MRTAHRRPRGASSATVAALLVAVCAALIGTVLRLAWRTARTTPGLVLIACGALCAALRHPGIGLALAGLGALIYHTQCYRTPYTPCPRCAGAGHLRPRRRRARMARRCWLCHGKGVRMRWGRAAMNAWRRATYIPPTTADPALDARPAGPAGPVASAEALRAVHDTRPARPVPGPEGPRP